MPAVSRPPPRSEPASVRRFRLVNVGLAKTGTTSVAGIFGRYRAAHEFLFGESVRQISSWQRGELSDEAFREFVLWRQREGDLEVDSASFNHHFLHVLVEALPDARFVFTIRDCFSWFDSIFGMGLRAEGAVPEWMMEYGRFIASERVEEEAIAAPLDLVAALPELVDGLFRYWGEMNRQVLERLPPGRSLVLRTDELSTALDRLALFVGVPRDTLVTAARHRNRAPQKLGLLETLDRGLLEDRYERHCRELMERVFPDLSLDRVLAARSQTE